MAKWLTFAPILGNYNTDFLKKIGNVKIGYVKLIVIPDWLKADELLKYLSFSNKQEMKDAQFMFVSEYSADSLGDPDPEWSGEKPRGRQQMALEKIQISNLALWLACPSPIAFDLVFHVDTDSQILREFFSTGHIIHHVNDSQNRHSKKQFNLAHSLSLSIQALNRETTVWVAVRTLFDALKSRSWENRFLLLWIILEALFGTSTEISYRISQRIGFFLSKSRKDAAELYKEAKRSYDWRSKVVHGMRHKLKQDESEQILYMTEYMVRNALFKILTDRKLIGIFTGNNDKREIYLDSLIFA